MRRPKIVPPSQADPDTLSSAFSAIDETDETVPPVKCTAEGASGATISNEAPPANGTDRNLDVTFSMMRKPSRICNPRFYI